ncbi:MAG: hypothetical protein DIU65_15340 [Proteobacteria bacterium]|nr:MAG: hypothetical protein DIU65_15340 [Pseudomonadota bacterium]
MRSHNRFLRHVSLFVCLYIAGTSPLRADEAPPLDELLTGRFVLVAERRVAGVSSLLSEERSSVAGSIASFGDTLHWPDQPACPDWSAAPLPEGSPVAPDPMLSDVELGPAPGAEDRRIGTNVRLLCGRRQVALLRVIDRRVLVEQSTDGARYRIYERPLGPEIILRLQRKLAEFGLLDGEPNGVVDEATREAVAAYAEQRGAAYRFAEAIISENLLEGLLRARSDNVAGEIAAAQAKFGFRLLELLAESGRSSVNLSVSPASAAAVLAYLHLGADADTRASLIETLGLTHHTQAEYLRETARQLSRAREDAPLAFVNALFVDSGFEIYPEARNLFAAEGMPAQEAQLTTPAGVEQVNAWVRSATGELIDGILDDPLPVPGVVAINAFHFRDRWQVPFQKARNAAFFLTDGSRVDVPMMHLEDRKLACQEEGRFVAARLPYMTEGFSLVIVTTNDKPAHLAEFTAAENWLASSFTSGEPCAVVLPKFGVRSSADLLPALKRMGFEQDPARSFARLSRNPLEFTHVLQRTVMDVSETGTEVAATTAAVGLLGTAVRRLIRVRADKPFLFALMDERKGLALLTGYMADPRPEVAH